MKNTKEKIKVMQAYEDGKQIQYKGKDWEDVGKPRWNWAACDYRIKPEEKKLFGTHMQIKLMRLKLTLQD